MSSCARTREEIHNDGINQYDLWYTTDHHWTTEGGFYAYKKIIDYMEAIGFTSVDPTVKDESNYDKVVYKDWHLGSWGQRTGRYYAGIDDFILYEPMFETDINDTHDDYRVLYNYEPLKQRSHNPSYTYDYVLENSCSHYVNNLSANDTRLLIINDSMGYAVMPFMDLSFKEILCIDSSNISDSVLDNYKPHMVLIINHPGYLGSTGADEYFYSFSGL